MLTLDKSLTHAVQNHIMTVIDLTTKRQERTPHLHGEAFCVHCNYTWQAVSPVGQVSDLECPKCHTHKGVFRNGVRAPEGAEMFVCNCGASTLWSDL